jgi:hypothetical protein
MGKPPIRRFIKTLTEDDRLLVALRDEIYGGSWKRMRQDLLDRLEGRPYILKLAARIRDDIGRIDKLEKYERRYNVNVAEMMK